MLSAVIQLLFQLKVNELEEKLTAAAKESADLRSQRLKSTASTFPFFFYFVIF
jgi:hypothetical protein